MTNPYTNPYGTHPAPSPGTLPTALWFTERLTINWLGVVGGRDTAIWATPVFDLRPDLRTANSSARYGLPVWSSSARLYVQFFGLIAAANNTQNLKIEYSELANTTLGHVYNAQPNPTAADPGIPNQVSNQAVERVTARVDMTAEVMQGTNQPPSAVAVFTPLGEGYPVRYWQLIMFFSNVGVVGPAISMQAAVY